MNNFIIANEPIIAGALQAGWTLESDAVGPAVFKDIITGEHKLETMPDNSQFDVSPAAEVLTLALAFTVGVLDLIAHIRAEQKRKATVEEIVTELQKRQLSQELDPKSKMLAIVYIVDKQQEL